MQFRVIALVLAYYSWPAAQPAFIFSQFWKAATALFIPWSTSLSTWHSGPLLVFPWVFSGKNRISAWPGEPPEAQSGLLRPADPNVQSRPLFLLLFADGGEVWFPLLTYNISEITESNGANFIELHFVWQGEIESKEIHLHSGLLSYYTKKQHWYNLHYWLLWLSNHKLCQLLDCLQ